MAGMFDVIKLFNEHNDIFVKLPEFLDAWIGFMRRAGASFLRIETRLDAIDSKLQMIIDGPQTVTPEIHGTVAEWAANDPRNQRKRQ